MVWLHTNSGNLVDRQKIGQDAEKTAERYLMGKGFRLVCRNFRCRSGEIDRIFIDNEMLVFVEVRYRGDGSWASGAATVTKTKQLRLIRAASYYLMQKKLWHLPCRFDVIAIAPSKTDSQDHDILWIPHAFEANAS